MPIFLHLEIAGNVLRGEAEAAGYEDDIEVENFRLNYTAKAPPRVDRQNVKPIVTYGDGLTISKLYDKASVNIAKFMNQRTPYDHAQLVVEHPILPGGSKKYQNPVMTIDLEDGFIDSVKLTVSESSKGSTVKENVTLTFRKLDVTYYPTNEDDRVNRSGGVVFIGPTPVAVKR